MVHIVLLLIVNYNQTVLREGIDYDINKDINGITMKAFNLKTDDILQFMVIKQTI